MKTTLKFFLLCFLIVAILYYILPDNASTQKLPITIPPSAFSDGYNIEVFEQNLDSRGVPTVIGDQNNKTGYHPSHICRYGLYLAARFERDGSDEDRKKMNNVMRWVKENKKEKNGFITWELYKDNPSFRVKSPWTSALTNAWCAGALLQGYAMTGDRSLERDAKKALDYLFIPVGDGGGLSFWPDGDIWFEEAPSTETNSHILNGYIYAIDTLDMFRSFYKSDKYNDYYKRSMDSLLNKVDLYDVGYGSIYDQYTKGNKLGMSYHKIHYKQLYYAYLRTNAERFQELSKKWFELQFQSKYNVQNISEDGGIPRYDKTQLNDGRYWYSYWLAKSPADVTVNFEKPYKINTINIFTLPDSREVKSVSVSYKDEDGRYVPLKSEEFDLKQVGYNNSNGNETTVYQLSPKIIISTDYIRMMFESDANSETVAIRELGIYKDMEEEYQKEMSKYQYVKYISDQREGLNKSSI
jgi:hypothetical protein